MKVLNDLEKQFYAKQIKLPGWGLARQSKIKNAHVLLVGLGGLGSPAAYYLAMAGVGRLSLVDGDFLALDNFNRQILYEYKDVKQKKVFCAQEKLRKINPFIEVRAHDVHLDAANYSAIVKGVDLIVDATDNFPTTYLLHDIAYQRRINLIQANIYGFSASLNVFLFKDFREESSCYRCLWPKIPSDDKCVRDCDEVGILGSSVGILGSYQSLMALEALTSPSIALSKFRKIFFLKSGKIDAIPWLKDENCPLCRAKSKTEADLNSDLAIFDWEIDWETAWSKMPQPFYVVDLRKEKKHFPDLSRKISESGCRVITKNDFLEKLFFQDKHSNFLVFCQRGITSRTLVKQMKEKHDASNVFSLRGGVNSFLSQ